MGSIFGIGTGSAAPTSAWVASRMPALLLGSALMLGGAASPGSVEAQFTGLRSAKGQVMVCMTRDRARFPSCQNDPQAHRERVPAAASVAVRFDGLPSGDYAIAMLHDENGNGRLDKTMGMPREGFGFSRNPAIRLGPPRFASAQFAVGSGTVDETVRVKYML